MASKKKTTKPKKPALQTQRKRKNACDKLTAEAEKLGLYDAPPLSPGLGQEGKTDP